MALDAARVTEVWAPGVPAGMLGSGYLLDGALVLTAGHVVDRAWRAMRGATAWQLRLGPRDAGVARR